VLELIVDFQAVWKSAQVKTFAERLEKKNKRRMAKEKGDDGKNFFNEGAMLKAFAERIPGTNIVVWRGARHTHLAEAVFARLYAKFRIWASELSRVSKSFRNEWTYEPSVNRFLDLFRANLIYLVEMSPLGLANEFAADMDGYVTQEAEESSGESPLAINLKFRNNLFTSLRVVSEEDLFLILLHEIAHLFVDPVSVIRDVGMATQQSLFDRLRGKKKLVSPEALQEAMHSGAFYAAFLFNYNIAVRAGLQIVEDWSIRDRKRFHNYLLYPRRTEEADELEASLTKEGAIKRTRDDQMSSFSDDDEDDDTQSAKYMKLFSRYLGAPVDAATIRRAVAQWQQRGQLNAFLNEVFTH
jgi:hypothetical protein